MISASAVVTSPLPLTSPHWQSSQEFPTSSVSAYGRQSAPNIAPRICEMRAAGCAIPADRLQGKCSLNFLFSLGFSHPDRNGL
jgi:hypothetical protein